MLGHLLVAMIAVAIGASGCESKERPPAANLNSAGVSQASPSIKVDFRAKVEEHAALTRGRLLHPTRRALAYYTLKGDLEGAYSGYQKEVLKAANEFERRALRERREPELRRRIAAEAESLRNNVYSEVIPVRVREYDFQRQGYCLTLPVDYTQGCDGGFMYRNWTKVGEGGRLVNLLFYHLSATCAVPGTEKIAYLLSMPEAEARSLDLLGLAKKGFVGAEVFYRFRDVRTCGPQYSPVPFHGVTVDALALRLVGDNQGERILTPLYFLDN